MPSVKKAAPTKRRASRKTIFRIDVLKTNDGGINLTIPPEATEKAGLTADRLFLILAGESLQVSAKKPAMLLPPSFFNAFGKQKDSPSNEDED